MIEALRKHPVLNEYDVRLTHRRGREEVVTVFDDDKSKALIRAIQENGYTDITKAEVL